MPLEKRKTPSRGASRVKCFQFVSCRHHTPGRNLEEVTSSSFLGSNPLSYRGQVRTGQAPTTAVYITNSASILRCHATSATFFQEPLALICINKSFCRGVDSLFIDGIHRSYTRCITLILPCPSRHAITDTGNKVCGARHRSSAHNPTRLLQIVPRETCVPGRGRIRPKFLRGRRPSRPAR